MKHVSKYFKFFLNKIFLCFGILLITLLAKGSDTLNVHHYVNEGFLKDSSGLLTVLKQNPKAVFTPALYSQNINGLKLSLIPQFSLCNWYDDVVINKVGKDQVVLSDSSVANVNYLYGMNASHEFLGRYSDKVGSTYMNLIFERTASESRFSNSDVKNTGFILDFLKNEGKHRFHYGFSKNLFSIGDNGGVSDSSVYIDALELTTFTVPVNLYSAHNSIAMTEAFVGNQILLNYKSSTDSTAIDTVLPKYLHALGYEIGFRKDQYVFSMDKQDIDSVFFDSTLVNLNETWDSLGFSKIEYQTYYQLLDSSNRNLLKLAFNASNYDWSVLNESYTSFEFNNFRVGTLSLKGRYNLEGIWKNGYSMSISHDAKLFVSWLSSVEYKLDYNLPGYFYMNYQGNHFNWSNSFNKVRNQSIDYSLFHQLSFTGIEAKVQVLDDWIYLDTLSIPVQMNEQIQYFNFGVFNTFKSKYFNIYTKVSYQKATSEVLRFPTYNLRNVFTYKFKLGRLKLTAGYMFTYFTSFKGLDYNPNLRKTYLQEDKEIGGIPLLDVFATVKIGEVDVFVKGENVLFESVSRAYYLYPNRPVLPRYFRVGFSWNFKN